jgi:hypothetical protein
VKKYLFIILTIQISCFFVGGFLAPKKAFSQAAIGEWLFETLEVSESRTLVVIGKMAEGSHKDQMGRLSLTGLALGCSPTYRYVDIHFSEPVTEPFSVLLTGGDNDLDLSGSFKPGFKNASLRGQSPDELLPLLKKHKTMNVSFVYERENFPDKITFELDFKEEFFKAFESACNWRQ